MHSGPLLFLVIIMSEAMQDAMNRIKQQFSFDSMAEFDRPASRFIEAEQEIDLQIVVVSRFEGEHVGGAGDVTPASVGGIHLDVTDDSNRDPFQRTGLLREASRRCFIPDQREHLVKSVQDPISVRLVHPLPGVTPKGHGRSGLPTGNLRRRRFGRLAVTGQFRLALVFPSITVHIHQIRLRGSFRHQRSR